jgi:6-phosphofructokinase
VERLQEHLREDVPGVDIRETILGHVVRGGSPSALDRLIAQRLAFGAVLTCEAGLHDVMVSWEVPGNFGKATKDSRVRLVPIVEVLEETKRLLDGTSPVTQQRVAMLKQVEQLLAF